MWSLLKRGRNGTYESVEPFHLFRNLGEQAYRYNRNGSVVVYFSIATKRRSRGASRSLLLRRL